MSRETERISKIEMRGTERISYVERNRKKEK